MVTKLNDTQARRVAADPLQTVSTASASTVVLSPLCVAALLGKVQKVSDSVHNMSFISASHDALVMCMHGILYTGQNDEASLTDLKAQFKRLAAKCLKETRQPLNAINLLVVYHSGGNVSAAPYRLQVACEQTAAILAALHLYDSPRMHWYSTTHLLFSTASRAKP